MSKVLTDDFRGNALFRLRKQKILQNEDTVKEKKKQDEFSSKKGNSLGAVHKLCRLKIGDF